MPSGLPESIGAAQPVGGVVAVFGGPGSRQQSAQNAAIAQTGAIEAQLVGKDAETGGHQRRQVRFLG